MVWQLEFDRLGHPSEHSPENVPGKGAFYYINHHISGTFSGLPDSTARHFEAS